MHNALGALVLRAAPAAATTLGAVHRGGDVPRSAGALELIENVPPRRYGEMVTATKDPALEKPGGRLLDGVKELPVGTVQ